MEKEQFKYSSYNEYLKIQRKTANKTKHRTINKEEQTKEIIQMLSSLFPKAKKVLCIGARHPVEVTSFQNAGFSAIGIDLSETLPYIINCDMSRIYENKELEKHSPFDIIYMSHSLEHCLDVEGLLKGIIWSKAKIIYIRVPIRRDARKWDCTLFDFMKPNSNFKLIENLFVGWKMIKSSETKGERAFLLEKEIRR